MKARIQKNKALNNKIIKKEPEIKGKKAVKHKRQSKIEFKQVKVVKKDKVALEIQ